MKFSISMPARCLALLILVAGASAATTAPSTTLYDPNPQHPWNRLHAAIWARVAPDGQVVGMDALDPLLWPMTMHLLTGPSHEQAMNALDEFLNQHEDRLITDPVKRAMMQSDLWAVFDWAADAAYREQNVKVAREQLQSRLAALIGRLAMSDAEIQKLPDNLAIQIATKAYPSRFDPQHPESPFLPADLFEDQGPWVCLGTDGPIAPLHTRVFSGRSEFSVFLNLPGGRAATLAYLNQLESFPKPFVLNPKYAKTHGYPDPLILNPDTPQFPAGTQVLLLRRMVLVDDRCEPVRSPITQSVQIRVYRNILPVKANDLPFSGRQPTTAEIPSQAMFEFRISRQQMFTDPASSMSPVGPDEKDFMTFNAMPGDPFEAGPVELERPHHINGFLVMQSCNGCHRSPGVMSFNTYTRDFSPHDFRQTDLYDTKPPFTQPDIEQWKKDQYNWGLLEGLLRQGQHGEQL